MTANPNKPELLANIQNSWQELRQFIRSLSEEQLTKPTDPAGWTVKDHLIHLAVWEDGINALLAHQPRYVAMGLTKEVWDRDGFEEFNAIIQQQNKDLPLPEVLKRLEEVHNRLFATLQTLPYEELNRPYGYYQADDADDTSPVINRVIGNTYHHYGEHIPWMRTIAES